ncbi:unnamed protein product, partial [Ectocarpus sp. 8 AP-2014]
LTSFRFRATVPTSADIDLDPCRKRSNPRRGGTGRRKSLPRVRRRTLKDGRFLRRRNEKLAFGFSLGFGEARKNGPGHGARLCHRCCHLSELRTSAATSGRSRGLSGLRCFPRLERCLLRLWLWHQQQRGLFKALVAGGRGLVVVVAGGGGVSVAASVVHYDVRETAAAIADGGRAATGRRHSRAQLVLGGGAAHARVLPAANHLHEGRRRPPCRLRPGITLPPRWSPRRG